MVQAFWLEGSGAKYSPRWETCSESCRLTTPGCTVARWLSTSTSRMRFMREKAITRPFSCGIEPPLSPVPAPRATTAMPSAVASRMIWETCCVFCGKTTAPGVLLRIPASYSYSMRSSGRSRTASRPAILRSCSTRPGKFTGKSSAAFERFYILLSARVCLNIGAHGVGFNGFLVEMAAQQIAQREKADQHGAVAYRQMSDAVHLHQAHGCFRTAAGRDRVQVGGHHLGNIGGQRTASLGYHPHHKVPFGEDADQLRAIEDGNGAHVALRHILGGLKDGLVGLDVVDCATAQQVADGRHSALPGRSCPGEPNPRRTRPEQYSGSPTPVNSQAATSLRFPGASPALGSGGRKRV